MLINKPEKKESKVQVSGCDIDGLSRGKIINATHFEHSLSGGFGKYLLTT